MRDLPASDRDKDRTVGRWSICGEPLLISHLQIDDNTINNPGDIHEYPLSDLVGDKGDAGPASTTTAAAGVLLARH